MMSKNDMPERIWAWDIGYETGWWRCQGDGTTEYVRADTVATELELLRAVVLPDDVTAEYAIYNLRCWAEDLKQTGRHSDIAEFLKAQANALEAYAKWQEERDE